MVKFLKPGKVVILLSGRYAGKKAVIVQNKDDGSSLRPYGHAVVVGLSKEPRKVIRKISQKKQARRSSIKTFIKTVNYQHMMPTRYTLDVDLKNVISAEALETATKKTEARKEAKKLLEEKFKSGKNRWFFSKLRF
ncbi:component of cytosolic 80S ribosome and 60S large subunit [Volvox carteri f. nagariensis]|uniref:60S ribosomal protein L27 n=1 Tax=Volvox carteri f. nagariensis TaxID=3068 RepID=D8TTF8_VOLCA|nr:component of cytosolic 80S ribosome and 60S large subunit [Volvox carteri f. nagariensis]EFJ49298.1 component of cytosolic 80S ribosome and 60S large subunit [Volvox carteri f. nagariensis]|eukprot:XP_002949746.1 component of cytosolic 80S ribosome and 60S large subunit [Volvox carteri f. nagariensis]